MRMLDMSSWANRKQNLELETGIYLMLIACGNSNLEGILGDSDGKHISIPNFLML